jgi:hypothetical protein
VAEPDLDIGSTPQFEAPTIAGLMRQMAARPEWAKEEPLEVDSVTFEQAKREMEDIQRRQGRTVSAAPWIAARNFLLRGVPVVTNDLQD